MPYLGIHEFQTAVHRPYNWVVADATARDALTVTADDAYKTALQLDDGSVWTLMDDTPTWVQVGDGGGGGGGATISTSAYASPPSSPATGDLWLPSDSFMELRRSASAWVPWGPLFPFTAPISGDFSWVNQGSATLDATKGGVYIKIPASAGASFRIREKAVPTAPYTITLACLPNFTASSTQVCGLGLRDSSSGKLIAFYVGVDRQITVGHWTDYATFSANVLTETPGVLPTPIFLRITDDNTNRIFSISTNGQFFHVLLSESRTAFATPTMAGFLHYSSSTTEDSGALFLSWKEG